MKTLCRFIVLIGCGCLAVGQTTNSGYAKSYGSCSVAHHGNNDVITIQHCGIGEEQAQKIIMLLKNLTAHRDTKAVNDKLDELIMIAGKPSQVQNCVGSACAQGEGAQATFNQYGAPKYTMSEAQERIIREDMKNFAGTNIEVLSLGEEPDTQEYADKLSDALRFAGLRVHRQSSMLTDAPSGLCIWYNVDLAAAAYALFASMQKVQSNEGPLTRRGSGIPGKITIVVSPRR